VTDRRRVLLVATTTGYQTRAFGDAAERLGVELVFATDRCHMLEDPWLDSAIPVRFHDLAGSVAMVMEAARERPFEGVVAVGDRPALLAAHLQQALGLAGHPPEGAAGARNKRRTRERLRAAGLLVPDFIVAPLSAGVDAFNRIAFPAVLKPTTLSGSRGVMRVDGRSELHASLRRLRALLMRPEVRAEREPEQEEVVLEAFIPGHEFAVEALMEHGRFQTLAIFDKPDPLDGPFFEETIYVTPPALTRATEAAIVAAVSTAAAAVGLRHGPVHAECRVGSGGVFVLETAARPIGGLCARSLRFVRNGLDQVIALEELLLRHATGEPCEEWHREESASGVMMIPIPRRGIYRGVAGVREALAIDHVSHIEITAKADQLLVPLPEGASYLGFIFARASGSCAVDRALRLAHGRLEFTIDAEVPVVQSAHG
jgi:biotin carboxylase